MSTHVTEPLAHLAPQPAASSGLKVPVTESALLQRLRRHLARQGEYFHVTRGSASNSDLGYYYTVDQFNAVARSHIQPEALARDLGLLKPYESVAR